MHGCGFVPARTGIWNGQPATVNVVALHVHRLAAGLHARASDGTPLACPPCGHMTCAPTWTSRCPGIR